MRSSDMEFQLMNFCPFRRDMTASVAQSDLRVCISFVHQFVKQQVVLPMFIK